MGKIGDAVRVLWSEPRAPDAPERVWRDWALAAVCVPLMIAEAATKPELVWRVPTLAIGVIIILALLWRRTRPLPAACAAFGATGTFELLGLVAGVAWDGLDSFAVMLILPYALIRWGSGRDVVIGALVISASFAIAMWGELPGWGGVAGASLFLLFPAALGASVRYQDRSQRREREQVRLRERTDLARELHDSVAHHVSAIAIQAQAGRALAASRPEAALEALAVIEEAASRSLTEMRNMVGALRDGSAAELAPAPGLVDIEALAREQAGRLDVRIERHGDVADLEPSVETTLFRVACEAITNTVRHARGASHVDVLITAQPDQVSMTVQDDGRVSEPVSEGGFGLQGMTERVELLGGTLRAGPAKDRGWRVEAILPRGSSV